MDKSDYIIYVDESGDHGLDKIDRDYPVFVLSFCCFRIIDYVNTAVPLIQGFKFKHFGHDQVILHEHHIRKQKGDFGILRTNKEMRKEFLGDINQLVDKVPFGIYSIIIDKNKLTEKYSTPHNPYNLAMQFGLEIIYKSLLYNSQEGKQIHFVFEKRGNKEDNELELEFRRICDGHPRVGWKDFKFSEMKFEIIFADKKSNSTGLQLADLVARPIGLDYLKPIQRNRAYEILKSKIKWKKVFP